MAIFRDANANPEVIADEKQATDTPKNEPHHSIPILGFYPSPSMFNEEASVASDTFHAVGCLHRIGQHWRVH